MRGGKIILTFIILLNLFLRFFRLEERVVFLGDQGRDLLETREAILERKIPLVGPLSNENIHTGPIYYYLLLPALILTRLQPTGPILFLTFLGVWTTLLIYYLVKKFFGFFPALVTTAVYASSPLIINRTSGLWNPVPLPFFTALIILSLFKIQKEKKLTWLPLGGIFLGMAVQLYIPTYFLFLPTILFWLNCFRRTREKLKFLGWSCLGILTLGLTFLPFFIFQTQNDFADLNNLFALLFHQFSPSFLGNDSLLPSRIFFLFSQQFHPILPFLPLKIAGVLGLFFVISPFLFPGRNLPWHLFFSLWFLGGILVLTLRPDSPSHPHYASFLWILPPFFLASFISLWQKTSQKKIIFILGIILLLFNIQLYFSHFPSVNDRERAKRSAELIKQEAGTKPFFLLLFSDRSLSDSHIRYLLLLKETKVKRFGEQKANLLFVVCDKNICPQKETMAKMAIPNSYCLPKCPARPEIINLQSWEFKREKEFWPGRKIYIFSQTEGKSRSEKGKKRSAKI